MLPGVKPTGALPNGAALAITAAATAGASERIWLLSPRDSDDASLSASSEVTSLPVGNVLTLDPRKVWRTSARSGTVTFTLDYPLACNAAAANGVNFSAGAVWRVLGAVTLAGLDSAPDVVTPWRSFFPLGQKTTARDWPRHGSMLRWTNNAALKYWRIEFADPGNALAYLDVGRLAIGREFQPTNNFDWGGVPLGFDQRDVQVVSSYGDTLTDRREKSARRRIGLTISNADHTETMEQAAEIMRLAGMWGDIFICLDPAATTDFHRWFMQGVFTAQQAHSSVAMWNGDRSMWTITLPLREV